MVIKKSNRVQLNRFVVVGGNGSKRKQPDFERACHYAVDRLKIELPKCFTYHSLWHSRDEVLPATERLADLEGVGGEGLMLLRTGVLYHDIGFIERSEDHEAVSTCIADRVLPRFGYSPEQVLIIQDMIMATRLPQSPHTLLEKILADADLDVLGRDDFFSRGQALRAEREALGQIVSDEQWYLDQLQFLRNHHYWTASARALRGVHKQKNLEAMDRLLAHAQAHAR